MTGNANLVLVSNEEFLGAFSDVTQNVLDLIDEFYSKRGTLDVAYIGEKVHKFSFCSDSSDNQEKPSAVVAAGLGLGQ